MITADDYLEVMEFPKEWVSLGMLPVDLLDHLIACYLPGNEASSEHDRNGAFHWWLNKSPDREVLLKLIELSFLDPDQIMASDVRRYIFASPHADEELKNKVVSFPDPQTPHK